MEWRASLQMCLSRLEKRPPHLPEVNELSHLKLEELCSKTGGRGRWQRLPQLVHLSPSRETELTSVSISVPPPASINIPQTTS